jgi:BMFP domain-containing protein YqiC
MSATPPPSLLAELQTRVSELLRNSPAADLERNMKALLAQTFQRVDLVTRDEFDAQLERLDRLQTRVAQLEKRLHERDGEGSPR